MRRLASAVFACALLLAIPSAAAPTAKCIPPIKCCRICDAGKACGNTCIAKDKSCSKGRGCACNVEEVCAEDP